MHPNTPFNHRLFSAAQTSLAAMPRPDAIIDAHITEAKRRGVVFAPWTPEGDAAFRSRRDNPAKTGDQSCTVKE